MAQLIVVSNREPYEHQRQNGSLTCHRTDGGVTSALDAVLRRLGGTWVAWGSGEADLEAAGAQGVVEVPPDSPTYRLRRVWLTDEQVRDGYHGYANQVLWPLCHFTLDRVAYRQAYWHAYRTLNHRFAEVVIREMREDPQPVWIHDFHLALLPRLIKKQYPSQKVSLFWHIPWPGAEVFRILPEHKEILEGLLAADCVTFQTSGCVRAFADCAHEFVGANVDLPRGRVYHRGQETRLTAHAISIDCRSFADSLRTAEVQTKIAEARERLGIHLGIRMGVGVDRLDYTKGLLKRLWALDDFFVRYPQYKEQFVFVQVAVPTRGGMETYRRYREEIREHVFRVNARHCKNGWHPIEYCEGRTDFHTLVAYYHMAELALVTSVFDGMNLVAKEYVASQVDRAGVLLISQMAGAAEELPQALIVNPYDAEGLADALKEALEMPEPERRYRMTTMQRHVEKYDVHAWMSNCLQDAGIELDGTLIACG
jgi:trehalose 6-phosphate synthase